MGTNSEINRLIYLCTRKQTFQAFASIRSVAVSDRRRDAGARTKQRLMDATRELLAERGEDGVTLRDITTAADANVASVSYHFGSLGALCCATAKQAVTRLLDEQLERLQALDDDATVEQIAGAVARPIIAALSDREHPDRALLRIFDRTLSGPPGELRDWLKEALARVDAELMRRLAIALPDVSEDELRFRWDCVTGILRALATGTAHSDVEGRCSADLEVMLMPVLAGALAGRG
jgi:AcrR family transcriptional regulator